MQLQVTRPIPPRITINTQGYSIAGEAQPTSLSARFYNMPQGADRCEFQWLATVAERAAGPDTRRTMGFFHKLHGDNQGILQYNARKSNLYEMEEAMIEEIQEMGPEWQPRLIILEQKPAPGRWSCSEYVARVRRSCPEWTSANNQ